MKAIVQKWIPELSAAQAEQFARYYELLREWNERMNLTAITEAEEVAQKHFADSALGAPFIKAGASLIDVGTGAGFPGLALKILRPDIKLTLLDSLQKRINFLEAVCGELGFADVRCIHARAEDGARDKALRGKFDVAAARAVAGTAFLTEWLIPFVKVGGQALLYKGPQAADELKAAQSALQKLGCTAELHAYAAAWGERSIIVLTKRAETDKKYPRKAGTKTAL